MRKLYLLLIPFLFTACTNHMYVGKSSFMDQGKQCETYAYWSKTDYIVSEKTNDITVSAGGQRSSVTFKANNGRISYLGHKKRDIQKIGVQPDNKQFLCGWVDNLVELKQFEGAEIVLHMHCKAKGGLLTKNKGYLPYNERAYIYSVSHLSTFSFMGEVPQSPPTPICE